MNKFGKILSTANSLVKKIVHPSNFVAFDIGYKPASAKLPVTQPSLFMEDEKDEPVKKAGNYRKEVNPSTAFTDRLYNDFFDNSEKIIDHLDHCDKKIRIPSWLLDLLAKLFPRFFVNAGDEGAETVVNNHYDPRSLIWSKTTTKHILQDLKDRDGKHFDNYDYESRRKTIEKYILALLKLNLPIYQLGAKLKDEYSATKISWKKCISKKVTTSEIDTNLVDDYFQLRSIKHNNELRNLCPKYQFALDEDELAKRLAENDLSVKQYQSLIATEEEIVTLEKVEEPDGNPVEKCLYVLFDISGSMDGTSSLISSALCIILLRINCFNNSKIFFRSFGEICRELITGNTPESKEEIIETIFKQRFNDWNTDILMAVKQATDNIMNNKKYHNAEILIVTDGDHNASSLSGLQDLVTQSSCNIALHGLIISNADNEVRWMSNCETKTYVQPSQLSIC